MPDPFQPEGVLPSVLRSIDRPGQAVRNLLRGNIGAATRQTASLLGDLVDAPLPGDWIPDLARKEDYVSGSELVGMSDSSPQWLRTTADIGVGIATDPLSWVSFGAPAVAKAGAAQALRVGIPFTKGKDVATFASKVDPLSLAGKYSDLGITKGLTAADKFLASKTPATNIGGATAQGKLVTGYEGAKTGIKRTMGWFDLTPEQQKQIAEATAKGHRTSKVWVEASRKALDGLNDAERTALGDAFDGIDWGVLTKSDKPVGLVNGNLQDRVHFIASKHGLDEAKLQQAALNIKGISQGQLKEGLSNGVFGNGVGFPDDYLQRKFTQLPKDRFPSADDFTKSGLPSAVKGRELTDRADLVDFITNTPEAAYERDAGRRLIERSMQQGKLLERAKIGQDFIHSSGGVGFHLTNQAERAQVKDLIKNAAATEPDFAYLASNIFNGMPPRGGTGWLADINKVVKPAMVYGVILPKMGSIVRNQIGMLWQAASTPGVKPTDLRKAWFAIGDSLNDGYGKLLGLPKRAGDELGQELNLMDDAHNFAAQNNLGGEGVITYLQSRGRNDLASAVRLGVTDGFVASEDILRELTRVGGKSKWKDLYDAPSVVFQGVEQRGRLAAFKSMKARGMSDELAAQQTKEAFIDYRVTGPGNRTLRDILPFAQFATQSIRHQAGAMSRTPVIGTTAAQLFQEGDNDPIYPWMANKSRINLGQDETGNPLWLTGLGLPFETLGMIPNVTGSVANLSQSLREGALSSTQPLIKTAAAITTGRDPYFDSAFGSYEKLPIVGEAGTVGRYANMVLGTGIGEPLGMGIARQIGQATDSTKPVGARALDLFTGGKLVSVDPDRAEQMAIQDYLKKRPDIKTYQTYYQEGEKDPEFTALMGELRAAKQRVKIKKQEAEQAGL